MKSRMTIALVVLLIPLVHAQAKDEQNVILITWDGVDRATLKEMLDQKKLPNLQGMIKNGRYFDMTVNTTVKGRVTATKPGHADLLTGYFADKTGVYSNENFQPIPHGQTIFERVEERCGKEKVCTLFIAGKADNLGGKGPGLGKRNTKGEPYFLAKENMDVFDAEDRPAEKVCQRVIENLDKFKGKRFLLFGHFADPDLTGHAYGDGEKHRAAISRADKSLGEIVDWLKENSAMDKTLIYVTTDHGRDRDSNYKNHKNAPDIWLATNDRSVLHGGCQADVAATVLERFGVNASKTTPELDGVSLSKKN